jgi:hypothetical protein
VGSDGVKIGKRPVPEPSIVNLFARPATATTSIWESSASVRIRYIILCIYAHNLRHIIDFLCDLASLFVCNHIVFCHLVAMPSYLHPFPLEFQTGLIGRILFLQQPNNSTNGE